MSESRRQSWGCTGKRIFDKLHFRVVFVGESREIGLLQDGNTEHFLSRAGCRGPSWKNASCMRADDGDVQVAEGVKADGIGWIKRG